MNDTERMELDRLLSAYATSSFEYAWIRSMSASAVRIERAVRHRNNAVQAIVKFCERLKRKPTPPAQGGAEVDTALPKEGKAGYMGNVNPIGCDPDVP